jgi:hypothetical protein
MYFWKQLLSFLLLSGISTFALADDAGKNIYKGPIENRVDALASIQPGLGVVMHEMGYRASAMYWAAKGGNWGLAQYELKELLEAQEVAELTRPHRAGMLKAFEQNNIPPLKKAIAKKDVRLFEKQFKATVTACNGCHMALGYGFIKFHVPAQSKNDVLDFNLKTEPKYEEEEHK